MHPIKIFLLAFALAVVVNVVLPGKTGKLENDQGFESDWRPTRSKRGNDAANDGPEWWEITEEKI